MDLPVNYSVSKINAKVGKIQPLHSTWLFGTLFETTLDVTVGVDIAVMVAPEILWAQVWLWI